MHNHTRKALYFISVMFFCVLLHGQTAPCTTSSLTFECDNTTTGNSGLVMNTTTNKEFVFDSFSKYNGGLTINGSTILKVKVGDSPAPFNGTCKWKLQMYVSNGGSSITADPNEWETLASYGAGTGSNKPTIDILQIRIDNGCNTPQNAGLMVAPFTAHGNVADIINPSGPVITPGAGINCAGGGGQETNGVGTYLGLDYNEFSFVIDYRLNPGFVYAPGRYELSVKFCLTEQ